MQYFLSYCHFFTAVIYGILSVIILSKDFRSRLNQACAGILACLFLWSFSIVFVHHPDTSKSTAEFFENLSTPGWILFGFFHLWFVWLYTRQRPFRFLKPIAGLLIVVPAVLVYQQIANSAIIADHLYRDYGWMAVWKQSLWTNVYFTYYLGAMSLSFYLLFAYRKKIDNPVVRRQTLVLLVAAITSLIVGTFTDGVLPVLTEPYVSSVADIAAILWAMGLAYAAIKYHMLDITPFIAAQRIIAVMKDLLFLLDTHGRIISVNPSAIQALACDNSRIIGKPFTEVIADSEEQRNRLAETIKRFPAYTGETVLGLPPGPTIPVALSTSLIPGTGIVCVAHDISLQKQRAELLDETKKRLESEVSRATEELQKTNQRLTEEVAERKQAWNALSETEERFRVIYENVPDGIFLLDPEGRFFDGNNELSRISGYTIYELYGQHASTLGITLPSGNAGIAGIGGESLPGEASKADETTIIRKDKSRAPVEINSHQVKIGDRDFVLGVLRDLTLRKKAEEEAEGLKRQLDQAKKMEAIGRLAGGIAHDFNNLLGGIIGYAGLLRKRLLQPLPAEAGIVEKIIDIGRQASNHAAQLLAFARKGRYQVAPVDIHTLADEVIGLLENTIDRKISLERLFRAPSSTVMGDRSQLHSALLNLGVNARDAMPSGGIITFATEAIHISKEQAHEFRYAVEAGDYLKIAISDNGVGMDEQTRSRVFEPFFSTKEPGKGTGLGLASVYGTVKSHNGFIEVQSEHGKGTTITICLPLAAEKPASPEESRVVIDINQQCIGRILVVDDLAPVREMTVDVLTDLGYTVHACDDGAAALSWFRENHNNCDLVILDLTMPNLSGKECFRAMKEISPSLKAIITSGHTMDNEIDDLLREGVHSFLQKPIEIEHMSEMVRKALAGGPVGR